MAKTWGDVSFGRKIRGKGQPSPPPFFFLIWYSFAMGLVSDWKTMYEEFG